MTWHNAASNGTWERQGTHHPILSTSHSRATSSGSSQSQQTNGLGVNSAHPSHTTTPTSLAYSNTSFPMHALLFAGSDVEVTAQEARDFEQARYNSLQTLSQAIDPMHAQNSTMFVQGSSRDPIGHDGQLVVNEGFGHGISGATDSLTSPSRPHFFGQDSLTDQRFSADGDLN